MHFMKTRALPISCLEGNKFQLELYCVTLDKEIRASEFTLASNTCTFICIYHMTHFAIFRIGGEGVLDIFALLLHVIL